MTSETPIRIAAMTLERRILGSASGSTTASGATSSY
jgi:hypothetical protein